MQALQSSVYLPATLKSLSLQCLDTEITLLMQADGKDPSISWICIKDIMTQGQINSLLAELFIEKSTLPYLLCLDVCDRSKLIIFFSLIYSH